MKKIATDPTSETAKACGVLRPLGFAARHTFYIGRDREVLAIDRDVQPATSAEDMAAKLEELGVSKRASADETL